MRNAENNFVKKDFLDNLFQSVVDDDKYYYFELLRKLKAQYIDCRTNNSEFNIITPEIAMSLTAEEIVALYNKVIITCKYINLGNIKMAIISLNDIPYNVSKILRERKKENQEKIRVYA